ncbi:hypothetical protein KIH23_07255 [Flavobacterium sp. CYK-55]|uniref:hypothetical protein n=1 Tax=Flavobacterium sp. CYK-55 TaxID=2835529 RepID=UPI001BCB8542|nr:hypothetical protein [Flavobacterium sp. CYK-55]MBS7787091.1 hypothetical protein [Flavobacterium sp. CYK-55]
MKYFIILLLLFQTAQAQRQVVRNLMTRDSLAYITLFDHHEVYYLKYKGQSPIMTQVKNAKSKIKRTCSGAYILDQAGYGRYQLTGDSLVVHFNKTTQDSISRTWQGIPTHSKMIKVVFVPQYVVKSPSELTIPMVVKNQNNQQQLNNFESANGTITLELAAQDLPVRFLVNAYQTVVIDQFQDQTITYWLHPCKQMLTLQSGEMRFKSADLLERSE